MEAITIDTLGRTPRIGGAFLLALSLPSLFMALPIGIVTLLAGLVIVGLQRHLLYDSTTGRLMRCVGWGPWLRTRTHTCGALQRVALGRPRMRIRKASSRRHQHVQVWPLDLEAEHCHEPLCEAGSADAARRHGERLARQLRIPLVDRRSDPPTERSWQELEEPAWRRLHQADAAPQPAKAIARCERLPAEVRITVPLDRRLLRDLALPAVATVPIAMIAIAWGPVPWMLPLVICLTAIPLTIMACWRGWWHGALLRHLHVDASGIRIGPCRLRRDAIEEIVVAQHHRRHRLELISDTRRVILDRDLPPEELAWLRWRILQALADREGAGR